jgi:hypothetical protein
MIKALIDTNIVLDALASREPFRSEYSNGGVRYFAQRLVQ